MMASLLELDDVSRDYTSGGLLGRQPRPRRGRRKLHARRRSAGDLRHHRRVGQRQDDARTHDPQHRAAERGQHPLPRRGAAPCMAPAQAAGFHAPGAADLPEPVRGVQSAEAHRSLPVRDRAPLRLRQSGAACGRGAAPGRPVAGRGARTLSARTVGRAVAAHRHRACADPGAGADRRGRTGVDGRCVAAHGDRQPVQPCCATRWACRSSTSRTTSPPPTRSATASSSCATDAWWRPAPRVPCSTIRSIPYSQLLKGAVLSVDAAA